MSRVSLCFEQGGWDPWVIVEGLASLQYFPSRPIYKAPRVTSRGLPLRGPDHGTNKPPPIHAHPVLQDLLGFRDGDRHWGGTRDTSCMPGHTSPEPHTPPHVSFDPMRQASPTLFWQACPFPPPSTKTSGRRFDTRDCTAPGDTTRRHPLTSTTVTTATTGATWAMPRRETAEGTAHVGHPTLGRPTARAGRPRGRTGRFTN